MDKQELDKLKEAFHQMYDTFPGPARLIDRNHTVLAANPFAVGKGFAPGVVCAEIGTPESHRECKFTKMFETGEPQGDLALGDRIRYWLPVKGNPDICIHFAAIMPKC